MLVYKIDVLTELKKLGYNTNVIRKNKLLSEGSIQHIRQGEMIGIKTLDSLCRLLKMQPSDIIKYVDNCTEKSVIND